MTSEMSGTIEKYLIKIREVTSKSGYLCLPRAKGFPLGPIFIRNTSVGQRSWGKCNKLSRLSQEISRLSQKDAFRTCSDS